MQQLNVSQATVETAKADLQPSAPVTFEGVNAPEFEVDEMEAQFESQARKRPQPEDGLDDPEIPLTPDHVQETPAPEVVEETPAPEVVEETPAPEVVEESVVDYRQASACDTSITVTYPDDMPWDERPWNARILNLSTRTRNALNASPLRCFSDLQYISESGLKSTKGVGKKVMSELYEVIGDFTPEGGEPPIVIGSVGDCSTSTPSGDNISHKASSDLTLKQREDLAQFIDHFRRWTANSVPSVEQVSAVESDSAETAHTPMYPVVDLASVDPEILERASKRAVEEASAVEAVEEAPAVEAVEEAPAVEAVEEAPTVEAVEAVAEEVTPVASEVAKAPLKILAVGANASVMRGDYVVRNFTACYQDQIISIEKTAKVPSLSLIEYGKGWAMLGAAIRASGWPEGVDVVRVPECYRGVKELMIELHALADIVIA
jgi:hypothetical protein